MQIKIAMELSGVTRNYGDPPLLSLQIQEQVPKEREHDAVVYLRERVNEEFRRVTGSPAVREYASAWEGGLIPGQAIKADLHSSIPLAVEPPPQARDQFNNASGAEDGSEHW